MPERGGRHIVVIGGGVSGLSAAHRLIELRDEKKIPLDVTLLESGSRLGGGIQTLRRDGFLLETGPDNFITTKPWGIALCRRIGLADRLLQTSEENRRALLVHRGRLHPIPEGFLMLAPTRFMPLALSPLFSWRGKLRMAMDLVLPARRDNEDESLASFVIRRLGREAFERAAQPLVSGVYTADPQTLSLRATMPRFLDMEQQHGSVIKAMWREQRAARLRRKQAGGKPGSDSGARYSMFVTFDDGLQTLIDALASRLPENAVRLNAGVSSIAPLPQENGMPRWRVTCEGGTAMDADGVIVAAPTHRASKMTGGFDPTLSGHLNAIAYASSVVINLAYRQTDLVRPLDGFGFVVPAVENRSIIACSFSSVKYAGRAPEGFVLVRCFAGGAIQPHVFEWDDDRLVAGARRELRELLGIEAEPLFALVHRHPRSMPQYPVGHLRRVAQILECLDRHPGLALAGNAYGGVGIPDCVHSGETAAERVLDALNGKTTA